MLHRTSRFYLGLDLITDFCIICLSFGMAVFVRFGLWHGYGFYVSVEWLMESLEIPLLYALFFLIAAAFCLYDYNVPLSYSYGRQFVAVVGINAFACASALAVLYVFHMPYFSRWTLFLMVLFSLVFMLLKRLFFGHLTDKIYRSGEGLHRVAVIGNGLHARQYINGISQNPQFGLEVAGYVSAVEKPELGSCLGPYENLNEILQNRPDIQEIVIALELHETRCLPTIVSAAEKAGVRVSFIPFYTDYMPSRPSIFQIGNCKVINMRSIPLDSLGNRLVKRSMDIFMAASILLFSSPLLLIAAVGIKICSPGPVIFRQQRVGLNKKPFTMYKLRTMHLGDQNDDAWSNSHSSRRFFWGNLLRKCSIDELPQCWNVLKGEMSMIGPRPEIPCYVDQFKESVPLYLVKHQVKPGISGWAQIHGYRGDTSIDRRVELDIFYIENWSLWLDLKILFITIFFGLINNEALFPDKEPAVTGDVSKPLEVKPLTVAISSEMSDKGADHHGA